MCRGLVVYRGGLLLKVRGFAFAVKFNEENFGGGEERDEFDE